jgi:hypothetical protein
MSASLFAGLKLLLESNLSYVGLSNRYAREKARALQVFDGPGRIFRPQEFHHQK